MAWLQDQARRFVPGDGSRSAWIDAIATLVLVSIGLLLRLGGVLFGRQLSFWNDAANWAILPISVLLARRFLNRPAARLLFIGILSLSPMAIGYSKEFKPYGVSLMLHLLLPLLALRWHHTRRTLDLALAGVAAVLGVFFAQDVIFLYPGLFLVFGWECWRKRNWRQLGVAAGAAALSAGIVLGMYTSSWRRLPKDPSEYGGDKYGVFHRPKKPGDTATAWYFEKFSDIAAFPGERRRIFDRDLLPAPVLYELRALDRIVWVVLHLMGLTVMIQQRRLREAVLFLSPTLVCAGFNFLGYWPFGTFRTNVFMLAGMSAIAALGLDWRGQPRRAWTSLLPASLLVLLPLVVSRHDWDTTKRVVASSDAAGRRPSSGRAWRSASLVTPSMPCRAPSAAEASRARPVPTR